MSFLGSSGSGGAAGHLPLVAPLKPTISRVSINNGSTPQFSVNDTYQVQDNPKAIFHKYYRLYTAAGVLVRDYNQTTGTMGTDTTLVAGTSYYATLSQYDTVTQRIGVSPNSDSVTALTLPANMGTISASNGVGTLNTSWTAVNAGGDTSVTYTMKLYQSSNSGSTYTQISTATTTNTSYSWGSLTGGAGWYYYVNITPSNTLGSSTAANSSGVNVTSAAPPPPPPPPYFPPFFGPFFGPYFCLQADSPVMTWVDGKTLQKKVKDLQLGDKIVSYTFAELPENDSEYSLNSWNSQSMTPLEVKEATVVRNEKLVTQSTVFFNNDQNNRMSLEHLVFVKRDGTYSIVLAGLVEVGDTILKIDEESLTIYEEAVSSIEHVNEQTEIYKLDVTPYDIFFGGNMLTHNKGGFY